MAKKKVETNIVSDIVETKVEVKSIEVLANGMIKVKGTGKSPFLKKDVEYEVTKEMYERFKAKGIIY